MSLTHDMMANMLPCHMSPTSMSGNMILKSVMAWAKSSCVAASPLILAAPPAP